MTLAHLLDSTELPAGLGTSTIDLRVAALAEEVLELIIKSGIGKSIVLDHLFEVEN